MKDQRTTTEELLLRLERFEKRRASLQSQIEIVQNTLHRLEAEGKSAISSDFKLKAESKEDER